MANRELTKRPDILRGKTEAIHGIPKPPPRELAALKELIHLLEEAADTAEEARL